MQSTQIFDHSAKAAADLSAKENYIVETTAAGEVNVCNNVADRPLGVLMNAPKQNEAARVRVLGIAPAISDGSGTAIAAGDPVKTNGSGKAIKATANGDKLLGFAQEASSADGTIIPVLLTPGVQLVV